MLFCYAYFILVVTLRASDAAKQYIIFGPVRPCMCVCQCVTPLKLRQYFAIQMCILLLYYY